jgi:hypothetical protein
MSEFPTQSGGRNAKFLAQRLQRNARCVHAGRSIACVASVAFYFEDLRA